ISSIVRGLHFRRVVVPGDDVFVRITEDLPWIRILRIAPLNEGKAHPEYDQNDSDDKQRSEVLAVHFSSPNLGRGFKRHFSIGTTSLGMRTLLFDLLLQVMGTSIMTNPFLCAFAMSSESNANPSQVIVSEFHISRRNTLQPH